MLVVLTVPTGQRKRGEMLLLQMLGYYRIRKNMVSLHERTKPWAFMNGTKSRLSYQLLYNKLSPP